MLTKPNASFKGLVSALRNNVLDFLTSEFEKRKEKLRERNTGVETVIFSHMHVRIFVKWSTFFLFIALPLSLSTSPNPDLLVTSHL